MTPASKKKNYVVFNRFLKCSNLNFQKISFRSRFAHQFSKIKLLMCFRAISNKESLPNIYLRLIRTNFISSACKNDLMLLDTLVPNLISLFKWTVITKVRLIINLKRCYCKKIATMSVNLHSNYNTTYILQ